MAESIIKKTILKPLLSSTNYIKVVNSVGHVGPVAFSVDGAKQEKVKF